MPSANCTAGVHSAISGRRCCGLTVLGRARLRSRLDDQPAKQAAASRVACHFAEGMAPYTGERLSWETGDARAMRERRRAEWR